MRIHTRTIILAAAAAALTAGSTSVAGATGGRDEATGRGTAPDPSAPGTLYSFNFRARSLDPSGVEAGGSLTIVNRATGSELRGSVICLKLESSTRAVVAGRITSAVGTSPTGAQLAPGDSFLLFAEDHGRARGVDALSVFAFHDPPPTTALCDASESGPPAIARGRITVRDR